MWSCWTFRLNHELNSDGLLERARKAYRAWTVRLATTQTFEQSICSGGVVVRYAPHTVTL